MNGYDAWKLATPLDDDTERAPDEDFVEPDERAITEAAQRDEVAR